MMKTKRKISVLALSLCCLVLTACTGGGSYSADNGAGFDVATDSVKDSMAAKSFTLGNSAEEAYSDEYYDDYNEDYEGSYVEEIDDNSSEESTIEDESSELPDTENLAEKLVYSGDINIDTLDYDNSVSAFKQLVTDNKGFIESENFSDGNDNYDYNWNYYEPSESHKKYTAIVRIPSKNYDTVLNGASELGDVRSKNSNVQNFTQEYKDVQISLDILQKSYDSYSSMLNDANDIEYVIRIQDKLLELQTQIEQAKSRLQSIDNDVAYSYLNISIKEVSKYEETPPKTDTFIQRLVATCKESAQNFLDTLEDLLFAIIMLAPYFVIIIPLCILVGFLIRKFAKKHNKVDLDKQFSDFSISNIRGISIYLCLWYYFRS